MLGVIHSGIVLQYKSSYKAVILDNILGKIEATNSVDACIGSLLTYEIYQLASIYRLDGVMLQDLPLTLAQADVLFLHHVLELCYHFIPLHSGAHIVSFLQALYEMGTHMHSQDKKIFLVKLLVSLGFFPDMPLTVQQYEFQAYAMAIDIGTKSPLNLEFEQFLERWLQQCIAQHPKMDEFKTMHFLTANRLQQ